MIGDASVVPRNEVGMTVEPWDEEKILSMFADQTWDFWSVPALMKATGFPEPKIKTVLNRRADEIRQSPAVDRHGHALFTRRETPVSRRERLSYFQTVLTKSVT